MCACFFFFKQKTAYELRISDWSSDVCSSDLVDDRRDLAVGIEREELRQVALVFHDVHQVRLVGQPGFLEHDRGLHPVGGVERIQLDSVGMLRRPAACDRECGKRSEEHTSELQSLMRISYAVFCLKKKKQ